MSAMSGHFENIVKKDIKKTFSAMEGRLNKHLTRVEESLAEFVNQRCQEEMVVQTSPPLVVDTSLGDATTLDYLAVKNEHELRHKIRSRYQSSPYTDPYQEADKEKQKLKHKV
ncbi:hypothetical protein Ddye_011636 [Dipteronia dyeriana]|uniref:Uncharacterized protein n=1 Tax=Dipteronia dyeriana TaxID=168575 RepID=A0AAD9X2W4_9ROSI|nr:hypothetical protein Ddye_011636 [Dipteronia dyeriana]